MVFQVWVLELWLVRALFAGSRRVVDGHLRWNYLEAGD